MKLCFIDTETTGLTEKHGIVQIAGAIVIDGVTKENFHFEVKPFPDDIIEDEALAVSGRTRDSIALLGEDPGVVYRRFVDMLARYVNKFDKADKFYFVAYNSPFDNQMMRAFFNKIGDKYFGSWFFNPDICVMRMAALHIAFSSSPRPASMKLVNVVHHFQIYNSSRPEDLEELAHDAKWDIEATIALFAHLRGNQPR